MKSLLRILTSVALVAALLSAAPVWADALNINFAGTAGDAYPSTPSNYDPGTTPINSLVLGNVANGAVGTQQNTNGYVWNNVTGSSGTVGNNSTGQLYSGGTGNGTIAAQNYLFQSLSGTATQVSTTVAFSAPETYSNTVANGQAPNPTGSGLMLSNYLEGSGALGEATVSLAGIPSSLASATGGYTLTVYVAGNNPGSSGDLSDYTVQYTGTANGTLGPTNVATGPVANNGGNFTTATGSQQGNILSFSIPQGATGLTITANANEGNSFSPIDGLSLFTPQHINPPPTPEPGSCLLMGLGAAALFGVARRRRRQAS